METHPAIESTRFVDCEITLLDPEYAGFHDSKPFALFALMAAGRAWFTGTAVLLAAGRAWPTGTAVLLAAGRAWPTGTTVLLAAGSCCHASVDSRVSGDGVTSSLWATG
jgi:hypothetical protein